MENNLNDILLPTAGDFLTSWLPGGHLNGTDFVCGGFFGGPGDSLKVNLTTGSWAEFASGEQGDDMPSLYARINNLQIEEAHRQIENQIEMRKSPIPDPIIEITQEITTEPIPPPKPSNKPVMIVQSNKAATAARTIAGDAYNVLTWPQDTNGATETDWNAFWTTLRDKKALVWAAQDTTTDYGRKIGQLLLPICSEVKTIDTSDRPEHWDATDAVSSGWGWKQFFEWAKPRASIVVKADAHMNGAHASAEVNLTVNIEQERDAHQAIWEKLGIATAHNGNPYYNVDNVQRAIQNHDDLKNIIWFDEFHQKFYTMWNSAKPRIWEDVDDIHLATFMQRTLGLPKISIDSVHQGARAYAKNHVHNEPKEWLEKLSWDGKRRLNDFLSECFGADYTEYVWSASKNFWIGMVARIYNPGCKVDNMLVLEGPQGTYKSTALEIIGRKWYLEMKESVQKNDFFLCLHGKLLVEIAELDSFSRADVTRIKQVITCRTDSYRAPYDRASMDHPRMSVFVGTTNEQNYLRDSTGGRRFWPVQCKTVKLDKIANDREQLFAEAVHEFKSGNKWWEMPKEETEQEQESRRQHDEWESAVSEWIKGRTEVSTRDIAKDCLGISIDKLDRQVQIRIGGIMRNLRWEKQSRNNGKVWTRDAQGKLL